MKGKILQNTVLSVAGLCFFFCLAAFDKAEAQFVFTSPYLEDNITRLEKDELAFNLYNYSFFVDNEASGEKTFGYTLPGFRLTPTLSYSLGQIYLEAGVSLLRYHGANRYPCITYANLPTWQGYQFLSGVHLMPYFRVLWQLNPQWSIVFGNIDNRNSHLLGEPLYNVENTFASDPESGLQTKFHSRFHSMDLWLNWQSFAFLGDIHQEAFTLGYSSQSRVPFYRENLWLEIPLAALAQHLGGENLSGDFDVCSWVNLSAGAKLMFRLPNDFRAALACDLLYYKQLSGGAYYPFEQGWALYPYLELSHESLKIKFAYFDSEDFVSLLGSPHFCNFSTNTPDLVFDRANQFYFRATYSYGILDGCNINLYCQVFHQNRITGDRPTFPKVIRKGFTSFSIGAYLDISKSVKIVSKP